MFSTFGRKKVIRVWNNIRVNTVISFFGWTFKVQTYSSCSSHDYNIRWHSHCFEKCFLNSKRSVKRLCVCLCVFQETGSTAGRVAGAAGWTLYSWAGRQFQFGPRYWCHVLILLQYFSWVSYNSAQPWDALLSAVSFELHPFFSLLFLLHSFSCRKALTHTSV